MIIRNSKGTFALLALCPALALAQDPEDAAPDTAPAVDPVEQYSALLRETEGLRIYNDLRTRQIAAQAVDLANIEAAIEEIPNLQVQLPPLLITMVEGLEDFVESDIPFLTEERRDRVDDLRLIVERSDVNDAEKLRRIFVAWSIEVEYGGLFQTYRDQAALPDGTAREADFIQLGRIALIYQTADEDAITGAFDSRSGEWVELGTEHRNSVRQAIRMGRNQIAPELVLLPVVPPQPQ
jgi:hypothetical protein